MEKIKKLPKEWREKDNENGICHGVCPKKNCDCLLKNTRLTFDQYLRFCCRPIS